MFGHGPHRLILTVVCTFIFLGCGDAYEAKYAHLKATQLGSKNPTTPLPENNRNEETSTNTITDPRAPCYLPDTYQSFEIRTQVQSACQLTNKEREINELPPLKLELIHSSVAQEHVEDMVNNGYFDHRDPDGNGFRERLLSSGVSFSFGGENIAYGVPLAQEVVELWMNSGPHRQNILNNKHNKIGIGYYDTYWVQVFTD